MATVKTKKRDEFWLDERELVPSVDIFSYKIFFDL